MKKHKILQNGIYDQRRALTSLQSALNAESEDGLRGAVDAVGASYQAVGGAQVQLGNEVKSYAEEMDEAACKAEPR